MDDGTQKSWVFGYGSLMWNPGFSYSRREKAILHGAQRRFCIYSHHYRGTPERPGLVLGLHKGGSCIGFAFEVGPENWDATLAYLRKREQVTMVYQEVCSPVTLANGEQIQALTYVADQNHEQYAGILPIAEQVRLITNAKGNAGPNIDYAFNTLNHIRAENIKDGYLEDLCAALKP
jgi:cation transport protein ChaC